MSKIIFWVRINFHCRKYYFYCFLPVAITIMQTVCCLDSFSQNVYNAKTDYRAVPWTIYEGLSHNQLTSIRRDVNGFLWIGTINGLNRFDGSLFKKYYHEARNKKSIAGNNIATIIEDSLHNLWFGTDGGLSRYDIKGDSITNFMAAKNVNGDPTIIPFWATSENLYALESYSVIAVYDIHSFQRKSLVSLSSD